MAALRFKEFTVTDRIDSKTAASEAFRFLLSK
jgi:hypothetical protein